MAVAQEVRDTHEAQLIWYLRLARVVLYPCLVQPWLLYKMCHAIWHQDVASALTCCVNFIFEIPLRLSLFAWTYGAMAHAGNLGLSSSTCSILVAIAGVALARRPAID